MVERADIQLQAGHRRTTEPQMARIADIKLFRSFRAFAVEGEIKGTGDAEGERSP